MTDSDPPDRETEPEPDIADLEAWAAETEERQAPADFTPRELESLGLSLDEIERVYGSIAAPPAGPEQDDASVPLKSVAEDQQHPVTETHDMADLERKSREGKIASDQQDAWLRKLLAIWSVVAATLMLLLGTGVFLLYMKSEWHEVPVAAILGWMAASVTEILGIVYLVASYLFPKSDGEK